VAVEADCAYSDPSSLNADVAGLDVAFPGAEPARPALRARRVPTCRKRRLHGREAARMRSGQGCCQGVRRERLPGDVVSFLLIIASPVIQ